MYGEPSEPLLLRNPLELIDTTTAVETPERVGFRFRLAGPAQRCGAWLVDAMVQAILVSLGFAVLITASITPITSGMGMGASLVGLFVLEWFYAAIFETLWSGQTPGKLLFSLRVIREDGSPGRLPDFVLRNLLRAVDFLPIGFGVGVLAMYLDPKLRRIGDMAAGTIVVMEERTRVLGKLALDPPLAEDERAVLPSVIRLTPEDIRSIEALLRRRPRLSSERAEELAAYLAPRLREETGVQATSDLRVLALSWARATGRV